MKSIEEWQEGADREEETSTIVRNDNDCVECTPTGDYWILMLVEFIVTRIELLVLLARRNRIYFTFAKRLPQVVVFAPSPRMVNRMFIFVAGGKRLRARLRYKRTCRNGNDVHAVKVRQTPPVATGITINHSQ